MKLEGKGVPDVVSTDRSSSHDMPEEFNDPPDHKQSQLYVLLVMWNEWVLM
jgi:hypothetical protein